MRRLRRQLLVRELAPLQVAGALGQVDTGSPVYGGNSGGEYACAGFGGAGRLEGQNTE